MKPYNVYVVWQGNVYIMLNTERDAWEKRAKELGWHGFPSEYGATLVLNAPNKPDESDESEENEE